MVRIAFRFLFINLHVNNCNTPKNGALIFEFICFTGDKYICLTDAHLREP
jgi:hypothetical protein